MVSRVKSSSSIDDLPRDGVLQVGCCLFLLVGFLMATFCIPPVDPGPEGPGPNDPPTQPEPNSGTWGDEPLYEGAEGLTPDEAEEASQYSVDPMSLEEVVFLGSSLFDGSAPAMGNLQKIAQAARTSCIANTVMTIRLYQRALIAKARELIDHGPFPVDLDGPEQPNGYAYAWNGKDPDRRTDPDSYGRSRCRKKLWGLDASGFVAACANHAFASAGVGGGIPTGDVAAQSRPATWDNAIPDGWQIRMVSLSGEPKKWVTGDIVLFAGHIGIAVMGLDGNGQILHSVGSPDNFCKESMALGPTASDMKAMKDQYSRYLEDPSDAEFLNPNGTARPPLWSKFIGVLRMIPECAYERIGDTEDTSETLRVHFMEIDRKVQEYLAECQRVTMQCFTSNSPTCVCDAISELRPRYCEMGREMICLGYRILMLYPEDYTDAELADIFQVAEDCLRYEQPCWPPCGCE